MLHQPSGGYQGKVTDVVLHAQESQRLKRLTHGLYAKHCGWTYKEVESALERHNFMTPEQARDWGLIDHVVHDRSQTEGLAAL